MKIRNSRSPCLLVGKWCLALAFGVWIAFGTFGCAPNRSLGVRIKGPDGKWRVEPQVVINSSKVEKKVAVDAIDSRMLKDILQVEVRLRNLSSKQLAFVYRYAWTDDGGFTVESAGNGWKEAWVEGYETKALTGVAPNSRATRFRLEIQEKK